MDPAIRDRRDLQRGRLDLWVVAVDERRDDRRGIEVPQLVDEAVPDGPGRAEWAGLGDGRQRIDHDASRLMLAEQRRNAGQVFFRIDLIGPAGIEAQQA